MSNDVKRYSYGFHSDGFGEGRTLGLIEKEDGNLVRFEDYAALEAENARLAAQLSAIQGGMGDEPLVVATAILGGLFHGGSGPELGDIDVEVCTPHLEKIQCETVDSSDDVFMPLMTIAQHERIVAALKAQAEPLAAAPPAAQDVSGLVEALEHARLFIRNGIELGYIKMPEADTPDPAHDTLPKIDKALDAHRQAQQQVDQPPPASSPRQT